MDSRAIPSVLSGPSFRSHRTRIALALSTRPATGPASRVGCASRAVSPEMLSDCIAVALALFRAFPTYQSALKFWSVVYAVSLSAPGSCFFSRSWPHVGVRVGCLQRTQRRCHTGLQQNERGHQNRRSGGTSQAWHQACNLGVGLIVGGAVRSFAQSKTVPSTQMQWRITSSFRVTATCAFLFRCAWQGAGPMLSDEHHLFVRCSRTWTRPRRTCWLT